MKKPVTNTKQPARRFRLSLTIVIAVVAILAIGAATVLSRQRPSANDKQAQAAPKAEGNYVKGESWRTGCLGG